MQAIRDVREHLIAWIREQRPTALPRMRAEVGDASDGWPWPQRRPAGADGEAPGCRNGWDGADQQGDGWDGAGQRGDGEVPDDARVFGGSDDGEARSSAFVGPDEPVDPTR